MSYLDWTHQLDLLFYLNHCYVSLFVLASIRFNNPIVSVNTINICFAPKRVSCPSLTGPISGARKPATAN